LQKRTSDDVDITIELKSEEDYVKLFDALNDKKVYQKQFLAISTNLRRKITDGTM
jgi:hypothetical protein